MKNWWVAQLGDVCNIIGGGTPSKDNAAFYRGSIPWATVRDMKSEVIESTEFKITEEAIANSSTNLIPRGSVVIATRVGLGKVCLLQHDTAINQDLKAVIPRDPNKLDARYLFWWLRSVSSVFVAAGTGLTVHGVKLPFVKSLALPLPPLPEQRRIVALLDEAFEGLAIATANAEKNLKSAREVFESYLSSVFTEKGERWREAKLSAICEKITDGTHQTPTYFDSGFVFLSSRNVTSGFVDWERIKYIDEAQHVAMQKRVSPRRGDILLAKNGTTGVAAIVDRDLIFDIYVSLALIRPLKDVLPEYLLHFINSPVAKKQFNRRLKGVGVPNLHLEEIREVVAPFPISIDEQKRVTQRLDSMRDEVMTLEVLYTQKLTAIAELKQSLLQKAFAGELTKDFGADVSGTSSAQNTVSFLTPDFHAGILAKTYERHRERGTQKTFGRVKAQKFLHLVESVGRIDLGRKPIKDAAGPNDFPHMLKAEEWARQNLFFEFAPRSSGGGYEFKPLAQFDKHLKAADSALKPFQSALNRVIDLIMDMNSEEAELFATVHAVWNNLIIDGKPLSDAAIVREAREDWHADKLKIAEQRFHDALNSIRTRKLEPDGSAKYVGGQTKLI